MRRASGRFADALPPNPVLVSLSRAFRAIDTVNVARREARASAGKRLRVPLPARVVPLAALAALAALTALRVPGAVAQPADIAAIQAREARNADQRTLASLERFRAALAGRFGPDPMLTMLDVSENEGEALVLRAGGAAVEHVIRQGERWIATENRQLRPWASPVVAAANAFPLSSVRTAAIRAWLDGWRKVPAQSTDFVAGYQSGFDPALGRVVVRVRLGSLVTGRLTQHRFDPATGAPLAPPPAKR